MFIDILYDFHLKQLLNTYNTITVHFNQKWVLNYLLYKYIIYEGEHNILIPHVYLEFNDVIYLFEQVKMYFSTQLDLKIVLYDENFFFLINIKHII